MPRKAFLLGRNTGSLRHCLEYDNAGELLPCDVKLMQDCFTEHHYEIILADPKAYASGIQDQLCLLLDGCAQEDTLILYFSCHSLMRGETLNLILAEPKSDSRNLLSTSLLSIASKIVKPAANC